MLALPPAEQLAEMVSSVTQTMLGLSFHPVPVSAANSNGWRSAVLPIPGATPVTVGLSSDESGCQALSSAMFSVGANDLDDDMIDDSLRELVNMTAGLVKSAMALDQALGLPKIMGHVDTVNMIKTDDVHSVVLRAEETGLVLWICEGILENQA